MPDDLAVSRELFRSGQWQQCLDDMDAKRPTLAGQAEAEAMRYTCHVRLKQFDAASAAIEDRLRRVPNDEFALVNRGWVHWMRGERAQGLQWAREAAQRFPLNLQGRFNLLQCLLSEASPSELMAELYDVHRATSGSEAFWHHLDHFKFKLAAAHDLGVLEFLDPQSLLSPRDANGAMAELVARFESLGRDCELGLVQRAHRVEPLSLMRWAGLSIENLQRALDERFAAYDDDRNFSLGTSTAGEYVLKDAAYDSVTHTFISERESDREVLLGRLRSRQRFLRRKLLEDMSNGEKIFVVKSALHLKPAALDRLAGSIRALGARRQLFVLPVKKKRHVAGQLSRIDPERVVGHLTSFIPHIRHGEWNTVLSATVRHFGLEGPAGE